jgi:hypothetical protein
VETIRHDAIYWRHDLTAVAAFIDRDNIDPLISESGFTGPIGLLSVDIDGNDYWVWEAIDSVRPTCVIVEYNAVFGARRAVTIPYEPGFSRHRAHCSNMYWGCSLKALVLLAERKGYAFVGCNSAGNNAYFVERARLGPLRALTAEEGFVDSSYREARDDQGRLLLLRGDERREAIREMQVFDVEQQMTTSVSNL